MAELSDSEWLAVQDDMNSFVDDLREEHDVRQEDGELIVFADAGGHELNEFAEANGVDASALSQRMHEDARQRYDADGEGDPWSVADPLVVYKNV